MADHFRCDKCGTEVTEEYFVTELLLCNECAHIYTKALIKQPGDVQESERGSRYKATFLLLSVYFILCLVNIRVSIRWNGDTSQAVVLGLIFAFFAFVVPIIIAIASSRAIASQERKDPKVLFPRVLFVIIIISSILLAFSYVFMLTFKF
jgi:small-conductance mechanosensitive channel